MNGRIISIATQVPKYAYAQTEIMTYMQGLYPQDKEINRKLKVLYGRSRIEQRHSVLSDFRVKDPNPRLFLNEETPGLSQRLAIYQEEAIQLATLAASEAMSGKCVPGEITNIIAVSCTGLFAPGLEFQLIKSLGLSNTVERHPINFVGCYASVPALHLANLICQSNPKAKVLLVSVELCTLHMQAETDRDTLTANAIFSDGCAACLIFGAEADGPVHGLELGQHVSEVHPKGETDMTWIPAEKGFLMRLSSYIPLIIQDEIRDYVLRAVAQMELTKDDIQWAFHPGGAQIIDKIQQALELPPEDVALSEKVLREHGNMSSSTVLYMLKAILEKPGDRSHVFCSAFGPGLTFESIFLEHV